MAKSGVDQRELEKLIATVRKQAAGDGFFDRLKKLLAAEALTQVSLGFRESRDPYDKPWKPPMFRAGKPLLDTGRLRNSFTTSILPDGFRLGTNVIYARGHQTGGTWTAKPGKSFRFPIPMQGPAPRGAGRGHGGIGSAFVFAKKITLPARKMVPEQVLGPRWTRAFRAVMQREAARFMTRK